MHTVWSQNTVRFAPCTLHGAKIPFDSLPARCMEPNDLSIGSLHAAWSQNTVRFAPCTLHGAKRPFDLLPAPCLEPNACSICPLHAAWGQTTVRFAPPTVGEANRKAATVSARSRHSPLLPDVYEPSSEVNSVWPSIAMLFSMYAPGTAIWNVCLPVADWRALHFPAASFTETE